jgi:hypothetical protein
MRTEPLKVYKTVVSLPTVLEPNTIYAVRGGAGFDLFVTDLTGSIAYKPNAPKEEKAVTLYQDGVLTPTIGTIRWYNPRALNIKKVTARLAVASDQTVTVRIRKNNTTAVTLNFDAEAVKVEETVDIDMVTDDFLTVDVLTTGGQGLSVQLTYSFS